MASCSEIGHPVIDTKTGLCPACLIEHARTLPEAERTAVLTRFNELVDRQLYELERQISARHAVRALWGGP